VILGCTTRITGGAIDADNAGSSSGYGICGGMPRGSLIEAVAEDFRRMIDRYGRLFAMRGCDNAAVAQRYLQGLTQPARGTFARMAEVEEEGCARQFQHHPSGLLPNTRTGGSAIAHKLYAWYRDRA
jgi:hypothetical protein